MRRITISIPVELLKETDKEAKKMNISRAAFIRMMLSIYLYRSKEE